MRRNKESAPEFLPARFTEKLPDQRLPRSGFSLLCVCCFLALPFQLSELLCRKNTLRATQERLPAFLGAAGFHAFGLPRFDLRLLIGRKIERCQVGAGGARIRCTFCAACLVSCKRARC